MTIAVHTAEYLLAHIPSENVFYLLTFLLLCDACGRVVSIRVMLVICRMYTLICGNTYFGTLLSTISYYTCLLYPYIRPINLSRGTNISGYIVQTENTAVVRLLNIDNSPMTFYYFDSTPICKQHLTCFIIHDILRYESNDLTIKFGLCECVVWPQMDLYKGFSLFLFTF